MYKVFVNNSILYLTDSKEGLKDKSVYEFGEVTVDNIIYKLENNLEDEIVFFYHNLKTLWNLFCSAFTIEKAAGGLVKNKKGELLMIYRYGKWDLPKGKIEKGESKEQAAIREVEQECFIENVKLKSFIMSTYHIFYRRDQRILKISHWYSMSYSKNSKPSPQTEEGIEKALFLSEFEVLENLKNTYGNIKTLIMKAYNF